MRGGVASGSVAPPARAHAAAFRFGKDAEIFLAHAPAVRLELDLHRPRRPASTIAPFSFPLYFSRSASVLASRYTTSAMIGLSKPGVQAFGTGDQRDRLRLDDLDRKLLERPAAAEWSPGFESEHWPVPTTSAFRASTRWPA